MATYPLITHDRADRPIAWRDGRPVSAGRFLADVAQVRAGLPAGRHMLNTCTDRYRFMVGLAAAMSAGKTSLLPSTQTAETVRQMLQFAPDAFCLCDADTAISMPVCRFPALDDGNGDDAIYMVPQIDADLCVAYVFTSGSTGVPQPHAKRWGSLVRNVQAEAQLCRMLDGRSHAVIGTVPAQHMYGFESTVLIVMQSANALVAGPTFYPTDICQAVRAAPRPRTLVTTPVHLRSVLNAGLDMPQVDLLMSATAPLSAALAVDAEAGFGAPLLEIYGSTETGQIAIRQSASTQEWQLFPGMAFEQVDGVSWVSGGHVEMPTPMSDVIEAREEGRFLLHGRMADMVNIAGKRNSLAYLNLQLNAIPGVLDGVFAMPDDAEASAGAGSVTRLAAFVVAPGLTPAALMAALRERMDPVFLPRPLVFVDALPRNATGKLPHAELARLAQSSAGASHAGEEGA
ncbi:MAG: AMP-binding enzyme family protein [Burkholderia sp.]|nr:AMP-binding enzyme family protein [Burkholderia sp.]